MNYCRLLALGFLTLLVTGCVSYERKPLSPREIIGAVESSRNEERVQQGQEFTFSMAAKWMSENSPELASLKAQYQKIQAVADIKTPWYNPTVEVGQDIGSNLEPGAVGKTRPFIGLGFVIPIGLTGSRGSLPRPSIYLCGSWS